MREEDRTSLQICRSPFWAGGEEIEGSSLVTGADTLALFLGDAGGVSSVECQGEEDHVSLARLPCPWGACEEQGEAGPEGTGEAGTVSTSRTACEYQVPRTAWPSSCFGSWNCSSTLGRGQILEASFEKI